MTHRGEKGSGALLTRPLRLGHVSTIAAGEAAGARVHDLIVHVYGNGGGPTNYRLRTIRRTRRTHSYLIVFRVPRRRARRAAA